MTATKPLNLDLSAHDWEAVAAVLKRCVPEHEVWAFGSRVQGTAKTYSDLDLAIISQHPLPIATLALLRESFDESDLTIKVDVVDWASTKEPFRKIIESGKVVLQTGE